MHFKIQKFLLRKVKENKKSTTESIENLNNKENDEQFDVQLSEEKINELKELAKEMAK